MGRSVGACFCCVLGWAGGLISDHIKWTVAQSSGLGVVALTLPYLTLPYLNLPFLTLPNLI